MLSEIVDSKPATDGDPDRHFELTGKTIDLDSHFGGDTRKLIKKIRIQSYTIRNFQHMINLGLV